MLKFSSRNVLRGAFVIGNRIAWQVRKLNVWIGLIKFQPKFVLVLKQSWFVFLLLQILLTFYTPGLSCNSVCDEFEIRHQFPASYWSHLEQVVLDGGKAYSCVASMAFKNAYHILRSLNVTFYPTDDPGLAKNACFSVCLFLGTKALPNRVSLVSISNRGLLLKATLRAHFAWPWPYFIRCSLGKY